MINVVIRVRIHFRKIKDYILKFTVLPISWKCCSWFQICGTKSLHLYEWKAMPRSCRCYSCRIWCMEWRKQEVQYEKDQNRKLIVSVTKLNWNLRISKFGCNSVIFLLFCCSGAGHFTQCIHEKATLVGCAMIRFWENNWCKLYFVCNYNETNINKQYVYETGEIAANCQSGRHPKYWALCNPGEHYDSPSITAKANANKLHLINYTWSQFCTVIFLNE